MTKKDQEILSKLVNQLLAHCQAKKLQIELLIKDKEKKIIKYGK